MIAHEPVNDLDMFATNPDAASAVAYEYARVNNIPHLRQPGQFRPRVAARERKRESGLCKTKRKSQCRP